MGARVGVGTDAEHVATMSIEAWPARHARVGPLERTGGQAEVCNAYNLRHRNEAILDIARAMHLSLSDLPEFPPRHRIGIRNRGLILRPTPASPRRGTRSMIELTQPQLHAYVVERIVTYVTEPMPRRQ